MGQFYFTPLTSATGPECISYSNRSAGVDFQTINFNTVSTPEETLIQAIVMLQNAHANETRAALKALIHMYTRQT